jgi:hypothetical protein
MGELDYAIEPEVECPDIDPNDAAFVQATAIIVGQDVVKEYVPCKIYPLAASFSFESVPFGMTPRSKVETPLPLFAVGIIIVEHADRFLAEVETEAKRVLRSFRPREYDTLMVMNILNGGRLNRVFEQMGVPYFARPSSAPQLDSQPTRRGRLRWRRNRSPKR